jgi:Zn-dependent metalloprotease
MRSIAFVLILISLPVFLFSQGNFKNILNKPVTDPKPFVPASNIPDLSCTARESGSFHAQPIPKLFVSDAVASVQIAPSGSMWIEMHPNDLYASRHSAGLLMAGVFNSASTSRAADWKEIKRSKDEKNDEHIRVQQMLEGYPILRQDMVLHIRHGELKDINGFAWTGATPKEKVTPLSSESALLASKEYLTQQGITILPQKDDKWHKTDDAELAWLPLNGTLKFVYVCNVHPNLMDHWTLHIDAVTLQVYEAYSQRCSLYPHKLYSATCSEEKAHQHASDKNETNSTVVVADGPSMVSDQDLLGQSRTVHGYLVGSQFFLIDASRPAMFDGVQSVMPNEPVGVIWTVDGQDRSPQNDNFELVHVSNTNNSWDPLEVSAHHNAGQAFEYFRQKFNRVSLNGNGGNIISVINIKDENGNNLDNAYWNGAAMWYGNGDVAFQPLAKSLDVAGHEMSHGVIQNTANLEYMNQSGAMNESFADVFGAMIDRDDWRLGEDVVNLNFFPSGALRDLSNPNNGGNGPNDNGWQPKHMNEFQNLPNTPEGDNGGVHVNSGITNRAFFLFATSVGKEKAEQIYYKALRDYLVKSSQFIDLRIAVEKAATDLHGAGSAEVTAARSAFDAVGIGAGQGGDYEDDIETNEGDDFILATDELESDLYWVPPTNPSQFVKLDVPAPLTRPSFTDDGTSAVYVDVQNRMILLSFNWSGGLQYEAFFLEEPPQTIWRNVVVSKDGSKIAYSTVNLRNEIGVFDFDTGLENTFVLYNPTTAEGISTGDVLYADAMEWDYSGEYIMYDALNRIESSFGDGIEYWDIGFINVWEYDFNNFTDGIIGKLFSSLPESVSIGNPSFAKNSPYIITFDYLENYFDNFGQLQTDYRILASNTESGEVNEIYANTTIGYPSYSRLDDRILFTYDDFGSLLLGTIEVQPSNKTLPVPGTDGVLITGAQKGVWFQTGNREFTSVEDVREHNLNVWPQPAVDELNISGTLIPDGSTYTITDIQGKKISQNVLNSKGINVSGLASGMYFISLQASGIPLGTARFIKG